jgi:hypothetical protein
MLGTIITVTVLSLALGGVLKFIFDRQKNFGDQYKITTPELIVGTLIVLVVVAPLTTWIGYKIAVSSQVTFEENLGGFETRAYIVKHTCSRDDGSTRHTYQGEPYQVTVDDYGYNSKHEWVKTGSHQETRYHTIPYTTQEWDYVVDTTLGPVVIAGRNFPPNPSQYQFKWGVSVPNIPSETGSPIFWDQAKKRIEVDRDPGPVTMKHDYTNYILAVHEDVQREHSGSVETYQKDGLMPKLATAIRPQYYCDRVYGVGFPAGADWQAAINRFNAALGIELQGDLHLIIVDSTKVTSADDFAQAVIAYWTSKEFGVDAFSKNGILVILGTKDGKTVEWARCDYGMPIGNEQLALDVRNKLKGATLDPEALLGKPVAQVTGNESVTVTHTKGALEQLIWGQHKFERVHMTKDGGYKYLLTQIRPTGWHIFFIILVGVLSTSVIWVIMIKVDLPIHFKGEA